MSFFDKVGEAFGWVKDTAAPAIGGALSAAQNWVDETPGVNVAYDTLNPVHQLVTSPVTAPVVDRGTAAIGTAFSYGIARPVSTFAQQVESASQQGAPTSLLWNTDDWRKAWNASEDISPGQALTIGSGLAPHGLNYDMTPDAMQAREQFFHNTWQGQVSSGAMDLALNLGADPTLLAAKAVKGAAIARNTFKNAAERDLALDVNAGKVATPSGRIGNLSGRMDKFFGQLDNKTSAEIMLHPVVKESDQAGIFASMFGRINQDITDVAARRDAQRAVFGAMLGNGDSIKALQESHALLASELQRLSDTPITSGAVGHFTWADFGQGQLSTVNATTPAEVSAQKDLIEKELARLETATSATHTVNRLAGSLKEQYQSQRVLNTLHESYIHNGIGGLPVRVVGGAVANRLPGSIAIKDPVQGFTDLENTLRQTAALEPARRRQLLDNYVNAATDGDRQGAVYAAEAALVHATAGKYGLDADVAQKLLEAGQGRRSAVIGTLSSRLYSAAEDDKFIHYLDPDTGVVHAYSRPILQSQIEDHLSIIDPRELDRALKEATHNRLMERATGQTGMDSTSIASSAYDIAGSAQMIASDVLGKTTRLWKDAALMRLAYPARVQIDSQMRLMTHMGALAYLGSVGAGLKAEGKYLLSVPGGDKLSLRNVLQSPSGFFSGKGVFKEGDYERALTDILTKAGVHPDDMPTIVRKMESQDGGMADLAQHMTDAQLARYRGTGEWGRVDPANKGWAPAYVRAVNRQIRNSDTAKKIASGASDDEVRQFVLSDKGARREWLNLKSGAGDDLDAWIHNVRAHVDHYLPTAEMRSTVLDREVKQGDVEKWFGDVTDRMMVHGESFAPTTKSAVGTWYEGVRNSWYKFAAEAPETTMARTPLYAYAFKRNLKDLVARHDGPVDADLMDQFRRSSDRLARREVGKILFDTSHSSNLSHTFRYVSPFFSAWEDMVKKWGGLFYDKPWAGVRFEQAWAAPNQAGLVVDENGNRVDAEGNRFDPNTGRKLDPTKDKFLIGKQELVTVPLGILPKALRDKVGADSLRIDKNSFNIVFQGDPWWLPGAGPVVQIPVNYVVQHEFPEWATNPVIAAALPMGVSDTPVQDQFLPSWIRQAHNAFGNTQDHANVQAMLLAQETARFNNGERGPIKPGEISDMTRNWFILRAVTANASPVSMRPTPKAQFYIDQAHIYRQQYGQQWQEKFYHDFPQWYELSLSLSNNETGIVASLNAVDAAKKYRALIAEKPEYGWAAVGPDNQYGQTPGSAFNQAAYAWQEQPIGYGQQQGFRGKSSPQEALAKVQASKGWMQYQGVMTKLNLALEARGLHSFQQKGAKDLAGLKKDAENILGATNESWRQDFLQNDSGKVVNFLDWAQKAMASDRSLAGRPDMVAVGRYTQMRQMFQQLLAGRSKHSLDDPSNTAIKALWDEGTSILRNGNIGFEQAWNRVLQHDDPSKELMGMASDG